MSMLGNSPRKSQLEFQERGSKSAIDILEVLAQYVTDQKLLQVGTDIPAERLLASDM